MKEKQGVDFKEQGRKNRARGGEFERKVRIDLEKKGWIVNKWMNNVDLSVGKIVPAKRRFNPFAKVMAIGTGFPDFICFKKEGNSFEVVLLEVKKNGYLDKEEKEKSLWYLENKIVNQVMIAMQGKSGKKMQIDYVSFSKKYPKLCK